MSRLRKLDQPDMKNTNETRVALLEQSIEHISNTLIRLDSKMDAGFERMNDRFDKVDARFDKMDARLDKMNDRIWSNFLWLLSMMLGLAAGGLGLLIKGFHWF